MNTNNQLVNSEEFEPVSKQTPPSKLTKALPKIRNSVIGLLAAFGIWSAVETFTSDPQVDAREVAGWQADVLVDRENTDTTTVDFEALSADEKMELRDLCSKIPAIPADYYKNAAGENIPVTTQHIHEIVEVLIGEFQQEKNSDRKRTIVWFIALLASRGFGTLLVGQYRKKDQKDKDAYFYSLFDEVKEYRKDGLLENKTKISASLEDLVDKRIADLRMTYNVLIGTTYDLNDQPLQAFIANKIAGLLQKKTALLEKGSRLLDTRILEVDAATSPDAVKSIQLDTEFAALLQEAESFIVIMDGEIEEQERDLNKQQELIQERLQNEIEKKKAMEKAREDALLLSEGGSITPENKKALVHFLDEMKDGKVTQQDIADLVELHSSEMGELTNRQDEVEALLAFSDLPKLDKLPVIAEDYNVVNNAYIDISDLYTRSVALGYTEMNIDAIALQMGLLDAYKEKVAELETQLAGEFEEDEFEINFDDESLAGIQNEETQKEKLEKELSDTKDLYLQGKGEVSNQLGELKKSLDDFLLVLQGELGTEVADLTVTQDEQLQRLKTLFEMRDKWTSEKESVLAGLMTHIEGGVAEQHNEVEQIIMKLQESIGNYENEKTELENKVNDGLQAEISHTQSMSPILKTLALSETDANIIYIQELINDILNTPLTWGTPPDSMKTIVDIVTLNSDGGYKNIPSSALYIRSNVGDKSFTGLLVKLNNLGKLMKIVEVKEEITAVLEEDKKQLGVVKQQLEAAGIDLGVSTELLEKLTEQLESSAQQEAALEIIKAALARVIDSIVSPGGGVTYDTLEEIQEAFNDAVVQVIFEKNNPTSS